MKTKATNFVKKLEKLDACYDAIQWAKEYKTFNIMRQFTINVQNNKVSFFTELLKQLDFIQVVKQIKETDKTEFIQDLKDAFNDVKLHQAGKKKLKSAKDLLDEL